VNEPDNIAPNPHVLPYGTNIGAPAIKPANIGGWKLGAVHNANKHFAERYDELKNQVNNLMEEMKWNEIIFSSEMKFKPVIGKIYHLYIKDNGIYFMSLFAPNECSWGDNGYQGKFRLNYDNRWEIVNK